MAEKNNEKIIKIPEECEELAELIGIILGDGSIGIYNYKKGWGTYSIIVVGDSRYDKEYLIDFVKPLFDRLFGIDSKIYFRKDENAISLNISSKRAVYFLLSLGLKNGDKIKNNQGIPSWIFKNKEYLKKCVRGLFDTDGCVFSCGNGSLFPRISLNSNIPRLREDLRKALLILGFYPLKWVNNKHTAIYRKRDVFKYKNEIGFSNPKHRERFKRFNHAPVV